MTDRVIKTGAGAGIKSPLPRTKAIWLASAMVHAALKATKQLGGCSMTKAQKEFEIKADADKLQDYMADGWKLEDAYCEIEGDLLNFLGIEVS